MRLTVLGCSGRMGREVLKQIVAETQPTLTLHGAVSHKNSTSIGKKVSDIIGMPCPVVISSNVVGALSYSDIIIDFSVKDSVVAHAELAAQAGAAYLCCVTGLESKAQEMLALASSHIPVLYAPNTSLGVNALLYLSRQLSAMLHEYDVDILDYHHRHKADAPSGTALALGEAVAAGRNATLEDFHTPPYEVSGKRKEQSSIGFAVVRAGDTIGEHKVLFNGPRERVELVHKASDRSVFAEGAIRAAKWLVSKEPGTYSMQNVLGF